MCRQSVLDQCGRGRSPNLSGDSVPVWLGERARDRSGDQGTSLIGGAGLGGDQGTSLIRGTRAGFTMLHSNRGRSPNNITALLFRPVIPCPIRKIFSTKLPRNCSEISRDFYPIFHHKIFDKYHYKISVPYSGGRFGRIGMSGRRMHIHIYIKCSGISGDFYP